MSDDTLEHVDVIDNVETKETKNGNEFVAVTTRDGTKFSCWNEKWFDALFESQGEERCLVYVQNGKYKNIDAVLPADQASSGSPGKDRKQTNSGSGGSSMSTDERIQRQVALKAAVELYSRLYHGSEGQAHTGPILSAAEEFNDWLQGDE